NNVKQTIAKCHPRVHLVFLPTRSPELNLIEVRWMWLHRQAINNSKFENEHDIDKSVSDWTVNYNRKHVNKTSITSLQRWYLFVYLTVNRAVYILQQSNYSII